MPGLINIKISESPVKDHFNVIFSVPEDQALHHLDIGETDLLLVNKVRIQDEINAYRSLGYDAKIRQPEYLGIE